MYVEYRKQCLAQSVLYKCGNPCDILCMAEEVGKIERRVLKSKIKIILRN